jgi:hypothetical protein
MSSQERADGTDIEKERLIASTRRLPNNSNGGQRMGYVGCND